jgi:hypothetical protein
MFADWVGKMSGGAGLLLTIVWFFLPQQWQFRSFLFVGVLALIFAGYHAWLNAFRTAEELNARLRPQLEFFRQPDAQPFFEVLAGPTAQEQCRWLRVGIRNRGGTEIPRARVVLERFIPADIPEVHPEQALQPMGRPIGTQEFAVPAFGVATVNVAVEIVARVSEYGDFSLCYSQGQCGDFPNNRDERFELILRAEGGGPPVRCGLSMGGRLAWRLDNLQPLP